MTWEEVRDRWEARCDEYQRLGIHADGSKLIVEFLADLEALKDASTQRTVTLKEASLLSGYSPDHLGLLIRKKRIPNAGRRGAPRIRVSDLPCKPRQFLASTVSTGYDVNADARNLRSRRHTGDNNGGQY